LDTVFEVPLARDRAHLFVGGHDVFSGMPWGSPRYG
jgi:hypothetical protein